MLTETWALSMFRNSSSGLRLIRSGCIGLLLAILGSAVAWSQGIESVVAPGKLIQGHAKWEDDCKQCHVRFDRKAQDGLCMDCHKPVGADVRNKTGFHGKSKPQSCRSCHAEHKGREGRIATFDQKQFDHTLTKFELHGKHQKIECAKCHATEKKFREAAHECNACHKKDDVHKGSLGVKCESCHSENNWNEAKFDHATARFALSGKHVDLKCSECHRNTNYRDTARNCIGCHQKTDEQKGHKGQFGEKCESCHGTKLWKNTSFSHDADTKYALRGKHSATKCLGCHSAKLYLLSRLSQECYACHKKDDKHRESLGKECAHCHTERSWKESAKFDHDKSSFPLFGKHAKTVCKDCHKSAMFKEAPKDCLSCHTKDDKHKGNLGEKCAECHAESNWKETQGRFKHELTQFVLRNAHGKPTVNCQACHKDLSSFRKTALECFSCHKKDDKHEGQESSKCAKCHDDKSWNVQKYEHGFTRFPLLGKHGTLACAKCHTTGARFKDAKIACVACHLKDDKHKNSLGVLCGQCHNARSWNDWTFDHDARTKFALDGKHKVAACQLCHINPIGSGYTLSSSCFSCHVKDDVHETGFGRQCQECHVTSSFKTLKRKTALQGNSSNANGLPASNPVRESQTLPR